MQDVFVAAITAASIPSALFGFLLWNVQRKITKKDKEREEKEEARKKHELLLIQGISRPGGGHGKSGAAHPGRTLQRRHARGAGICDRSKARTKGIFAKTGRDSPF